VAKQGLAECSVLIEQRKGIIYIFKKGEISDLDQQQSPTKLSPHFIFVSVILVLFFDTDHQPPASRLKTPSTSPSAQWY
jgi:hypothetical protein